jgi:UDP-glucose 4-epimerase
MAKRFLVTGGAGFIGSHIVDALVLRGDSVRVLDNLCTGDLNNLSQVRDKIEFLKGDLTNLSVVSKAMQGIDIVFHEAALASVPLSIEKPLEVNAACVTGTLNVLHAAQQAGVKRVIYAASSSCYGDQPSSAKRESDAMIPLSPYAAAKLAGELYCKAFYHTHGLETVCLRYFNVFGPRQDPDSPYSAVIPLFITRILAGKQPVVFGDGRQSRDFTFISNVVDGNLLAADTAGIGGESFNLANGKSTDLLTVIETLGRQLKLPIKPQHDPPRAGEVRDSMADITHAVNRLGYTPRVDFEEGMRRSIEYYRTIFSS